MTPNFEISIANEQTRHAVHDERLRAAVDAVLRDSRFSSAAISLAVVDDETMHQLNRQYLEHDWPTDVLSFTLEESEDYLAGEIIISADTAVTAAAEHGWPADAEQLLYVIHGALHLVGHRDKSPEEARAMRAAEAHYLSRFGFEQPPHGDVIAADGDHPTTRGGSAAP